MAAVETKELETIELLQTHYYKASYDEVKQAYLEILSGMGHSVISVNDDYCEIFSEAPHMAVTAKIIMQTPKETSIDFYVSSEFLFGASKKAYKFIQEVYTKLEAKYELKGLSLHK